MRRTTDRSGKKTAPIIITVLVVLYVLPLLLFALMAVRTLGQEGGVVLLPLLGYLFLGGAVIGGIIKALVQRLREIDGGEEEDASQY